MKTGLFRPRDTCTPLVVYTGVARGLHRFGATLCTSVIAAKTARV